MLEDMCIIVGGLAMYTVLQVYFFCVYAPERRAWLRSEI